MGLEGISIALLTEKAWVEEMMEHLTTLTLDLVGRTFDRIEAMDDSDRRLPIVATWWEDMCFKQGPLLSPALFEELMVPRYARIVEALAARGVDAHLLDSDGRIDDLAPGWLRAGIRGLFPVEALHTDPVALRKRHGLEAVIVGGVDKRALAAGRDAIDAELARLAPLVDEGGCLPMVDHRVPPGRVLRELPLLPQAQGGDPLTRPAHHVERNRGPHDSARPSRPSFHRLFLARRCGIRKMDR